MHSARVYTHPHVHVHVHHIPDQPVDRHGKRVNPTQRTTTLARGGSTDDGFARRLKRRSHVDHGTETTNFGGRRKTKNESKIPRENPLKSPGTRTSRAKAMSLPLPSYVVPVPDPPSTPFFQKNDNHSTLERSRLRLRGGIKEKIQKKLT